MKNKKKTSVISAIGALFIFSAVCFFGGCTEIPDGETKSQGLNEPKAENEYEGNAEQRKNWFLQQRMYPFDKLPENARRRAWEARPPDAMENLLGGGQWQPIGPHPTESFFPNNWGVTSGRINAIAVSPANPQLILIGGATGGIWRSTNGGTSFAPISDNQVDLAVGSIAFAPSDPNIVYAGMGDKGGQYIGTGVLKSTNAGQTWTRINNNTLPGQSRNTKILVHPTNANLVYAAQAEGQNFERGFFYSTDGGVSWTKTLSGLATDLVQHPTQAGTIYVALQMYDMGPGNGGVYKSTNSGVSWTQVYASPDANPQNIKIATTPAAPSNLYLLTMDGNGARIERSTNEGTTWTNLGVGSGFDTGQFWYNCYLFVDVANANTIYVGTRDVWRSTDGGATYTNLTNSFQLNGNYTPFVSKAHPDQHHFFQLAAAPNIFYIGNDGGLWRTNDGGTTFTNLNATLSLTMFTSIDLHPANAALSYGGTQDNGTQRRTDALSWTEFSAGDGGQTVIDVLDPTIVFTTYTNHSISRFNNDGTVFGGEIGSQAIFNSDRVSFYPPMTGNDVNSNLYFGTYRLYVSTDRGTTWNAPGGATDMTNGGTLSAIGVSVSNPNTIYTGSNDGKLMVSTNGGGNWTDRTAGLPNRHIKSIIVSRTNPNTAYVTVSGFGSGHVFKTTNAGTNWTDISGNLPDIPTNSLLISPASPTTLYVGTDVGVFRSTTDGTTWETFNAGMPPVIVSELDAQAGGLVQAATYGRGAYQLAPAAPRPAPFDYDGDRKTDVSIFRSGPGEWWYLRSSNGGNGALQFGTQTDKLAAADYTGDGKTDIGFFRPSSGEWFILRSEDFSFYSFQFGTASDIPAPADFDGDGKADQAIFRPSNGTWYILRSSGGTTITQFGANGDKPVPADYDGDGKADTAIFRTDGSWWLNRSQAGTVVATFGTSTDKTVPADYTGDGKADVAIFRPSSGEWFILRSEDSSFYSFPFGTSTDLPVPGDYDGDGKTDAGVFRPSNTTWYINRSTSGFLILGFGAAGDYPVPNSYVR